MLIEFLKIEGISEIKTCILLNLPPLDIASNTAAGSMTLMYSGGVGILESGQALLTLERVSPCEAQFDQFRGPRLHLLAAPLIHI